jgi:hypothetical protein
MINWAINEVFFAAGLIGVGFQRVLGGCLASCLCFIGSLVSLYRAVQKIGTWSFEPFRKSQKHSSKKFPSNTNQ